MLFKDLIIGYDKYKKPIKCGDICTYTITHEHGITNRYTGMICYDPSEYAFMFEHVQDDFPLVLMSIVNTDTIERIYSVDGEIIDNIPDAEHWRKIYNSHI